MQYGVRKSAEDSVFVNVTGASQSSFDMASIFFEGTLSGGFAESGIELQFELAHDAPRRIRMIDEDVFHVGLAEWQAQLQHVLGVTAQKSRLAPVQSCVYHQTV